MGSADQIQVVGLKELAQDVGPEKVTDSPLLVLVPALQVLHRVGPQQVAQHSLARNVSRPVQAQNLFYFEEFRTDAAVHAEYFFLDNGCDGHGVEAVGEGLPDFEGGFALAWVERCVH